MRSDTETVSEAALEFKGVVMMSSATTISDIYVKVSAKVHQLINKCLHRKHKTE